MRDYELFSILTFKGPDCTITEVHPFDSEGRKEFKKSLMHWIDLGYRVTAQVKARDEFTDEEKNRFACLKENA